ncbi:hypothetical protein CBR67_03720 [Bordetella hinzii]|uniref:phage tail tip lysozyme n=1 Tax=Bordetella hinzii TaxID=103855 RepID=UPI001150DD0E|nr:phage tail tip lysozyme [Bordetella hinzii]QDJ35829.1 hypothetical protein CBR67_03720 [Bordetella hinzii]
MATIIDALVVTLGLDPKAFKLGAAEVNKALRSTSQESAKAAREMEDRGKQAALFFGRVRNEALALLAVFTAGLGIKNFTANTIQGASSLGLMSDNLSMTTERLQAWQRAAERAGGSAEGITAQLKQSAIEVEKYRRGMSPETLPGFLQFGGKLEDLKDGNTYLLARARIVSEIYKTNRARAALAAKLMGISEEQFNFIRQGPDEIQKVIALQEKRSSISQSDAKEALRLKNIYLDLRDTFEAVGTKVLVSLIPIFEKLMSKAQELGNYVLANREQIVQWVNGLASAFSKFATAADKAAESVGGWKNVLLGLAALKLLSIISPMMSLAGALASIGASLGAIGGASGAAGIAALGTLATVAGGVAIATYSKGLNAGEDQQLAALNNPALKGQQAIDAVRFFQSKGYTKEQATGLVANLIAESNLDPRAVGDNGQAVGIAQWHPVRQADFKKAYGMDLKDAPLAKQLEFVDFELRNTERTAMEKLRAARTPQEAAEAVSRYYERPKDADGEAARRAVAAGALYSSVYRADMEAAGIATANTAAQASPAAFQATSPLPLNTDNSSHVTISGPVTVQTQATDAQGIVRELGGIGSSQILTSQANGGIF